MSLNCQPLPPPMTAPASAYYAADIIRSASLTAGTRVTALLPHDAATAEDRAEIFLVTDQTDKKGNSILVDGATGKAVTAHPNSVWARY